MNGAEKQIETQNQLERLCVQIKAAAERGETIEICGAESKIQSCDDRPTQKISTTGLAGIQDHQASDFTITVQAGTPVRDLVSALDSAQQYLPFDPVFVDCGATVGGLVATGLNGPCRLRAGGLRDFVIGCQLIDGNGNLIRAGGKVVKNAAGFDLPKFLIGSRGRFGLLTEVTFKVFPKPEFTRTAVIETVSLEEALNLTRDLMQIGDCDAIEVLTLNQVALQTSGPNEASLQQFFEKANKLFSHKFRVLDAHEHHSFWRELTNFRDLSYGLLVKVPTVADKIQECEKRVANSISDYQRRVSYAGNSIIISIKPDDLASLHQTLESLDLCGQIVAGPSSQFLIGKVKPMPFLKRVKCALDAPNVFGGLAME